MYYGSIIGFLLIPCIFWGQEKSSAKFGRISPEDFKQTVYQIDSSAAAVILVDIGTAEVIAEGSGLGIEYTRYTRIHILKNSGFQVANFSIPVYRVGLTENLDNFKASTYNFESGNVIESKLDFKNSVYTDKVTRGLNLKKFTLPNVKEGSIIEVEYKLKVGSVFNMPSWSFQGTYPVLWSEYKVSIPECLYYLILPNGYQGYHIKEKKETSQSYYLSSGSFYSSSGTITASVDNHRWVMKNVPGLKEEDYTSTIQNYISRIDFILSAFRYPLRDRNVLLNWKEVTASLIKDEDIGQQITRENSWLKDVVDSATRNFKTETEKAKSLYTYIRDNFTCINHDQALPGNELKDLFKSRRGGVATINFLLIAMLRRAGITAEPVLISTKDNGYPPVVYPVISKFNYLICKATLDDKTSFLDASQPLLGFEKLEWKCYNGPGRIINETAASIQFLADSIVESKIVSVVLDKNKKNGLSGYVKQTPGYFESYKIRKQIKETGMTEYTRKADDSFDKEFSVSKFEIENLTELEERLQINFDLDLINTDEEIIYINPMFGQGYAENSLKAVSRSYPVEMPYTKDEVYILRMETPEGYAVDELPKSGRLNYDDKGESFFEYIISEKGGVIMLRSRVKIVRTYFSPDEYDVLREFFSQIVNKHNEQIVFKKKK